MTRRRPPPTWDDLGAVAKRVAEEIEEAELEEERLEYTYYLPELAEAYYTGRIPPFRFPLDWNKPSNPAPKPSAQERAAIEAVFKRGDGEPLADLIRPTTYIDGKLLSVSWAVERGLSLATWDVIVRIITGEIDLHKLRGAGRKKMTAEERRAINPIHDAADSISGIELIIARLYPAKTKAKVRERAIAIAAHLSGAQLEPLKKHLRRGKGDRRRLGQR